MYFVTCLTPLPSHSRVPQTTLEEQLLEAKKNYLSTKEELESTLKELAA